MAIFGLDINHIKIPKTAYLTSYSYKSPLAQTDYMGLNGRQLTMQQ